MHSGPDDPKRAVWLKDLARLNRSLERLGVTPICDVAAAEALSDTNLLVVVDITGDHLVEKLRQLKGSI